MPVIITTMLPSVLWPCWLGIRKSIHTCVHTTVLRPFFRDHPGEPVPEENFWTLWCNGRLTEADTLTIRLCATLSGLISAHLHHPPPYFLWAGCPSCRPTNCVKALKATSAFGLGKMLEFSSAVLPAPSPYLGKSIRPVKIDWWGAGVVMSVARCKWFVYGPADATATPSSLASLKSKMVYPFWWRLTQVVLEKRPLNRCLSV